MCLEVKMPQPLSIFIITLNETDRLEAAIAAVRHLSDDIVVVDSGSSDGTQALAESLGARVVFNAWPGYGLQKQFGEDQCRHDWMLNIDADEVVNAQMAQAIATTLARSDLTPGAYTTKIVEMFPGETKQCAFITSQWATTAPRLYMTALTSSLGQPNRRWLA
jgi:glycosyltransferase involved in cell wall biosynthesis